MHKYFISYNDPVTLRSKKGWFKVDDVTSLTKEKDNERQQQAKIASGKQNARCCTDREDFPGESAKRTRTNNASLLEVSIDQIISSGKLTGHTVNLYFESLRNNKVFGEGKWGFATSYFYPSLHRRVEKSTYSKNIGNKTLWECEQLMVPLHLPSEHHWLLIVVSVVNLYLYVYGSFMIPLFAPQQLIEQFSTRSKKDSSEMNFRWLSDEDNWDECRPQCPKQMNDTNCGVFPFLFGKTVIVFEWQPLQSYSQRRSSN